MGSLFNSIRTCINSLTMAHNDDLKLFLQNSNLLGFVSTDEYSIDELQCKIFYYDQNVNKVEVTDIITQSPEIENLLLNYPYRLTYSNTPSRGPVYTLSIENK